MLSSQCEFVLMDGVPLTPGYCQTFAYALLKASVRARCLNSSFALIDVFFHSMNCSGPVFHPTWSKVSEPSMLNCINTTNLTAPFDNPGAFQQSTQCAYGLQLTGPYLIESECLNDSTRYNRDEYEVDSVFNAVTNTGHCLPFTGTESVRRRLNVLNYTMLPVSQMQSREMIPDTTATSTTTMYPPLTTTRTPTNTATNSGTNNNSLHEYYEEDYDVFAEVNLNWLSYISAQPVEKCVAANWSQFQAFQVLVFADNKCTLTTDGYYFSRLRYPLYSGWKWNHTLNISNNGNEQLDYDLLYNPYDAISNWAKDLFGPIVKPHLTTSKPTESSGDDGGDGSHGPNERGIVWLLILVPSIIALFLFYAIYRLVADACESRNNPALMAVSAARQRARQRQRQLDRERGHGRGERRQRRRQRRRDRHMQMEADVAAIVQMEGVAIDNDDIYGGERMAHGRGKDKGKAKKKNCSSAETGTLVKEGQSEIVDGSSRIHEQFAHAQMREMHRVASLSISTAAAGGSAQSVAPPPAYFSAKAIESEKVASDSEHSAVAVISSAVDSTTVIVSERNDPKA